MNIIRRLAPMLLGKVWRLLGLTRFGPFGIYFFAGKLALRIVSRLRARKSSLA